MVPHERCAAGNLRAATVPTPDGCTRGLLLAVTYGDWQHSGSSWVMGKWMSHFSSWHVLTSDFFSQGFPVCDFPSFHLFTSSFLVVNLHQEQSRKTSSLAEHHIDGGLHTGQPSRFAASETFVPSRNNIVHNFISISIAWLFVCYQKAKWLCVLLKGYHFVMNPQKIITLSWELWTHLNVL